MISLKHNIVANYVGRFYVLLIGILLLPLYVTYMGAEAFGLVGFFAMLQAWFMLLDMGLTPTMARETARFNGGAIDGLTLRRLLRTLEGIFIGVALLGALSIIAGSDYLATGWLKVEELELGEVQNTVILMAVIVGLRWMCGLYRGAITGFEKMVWLNACNMAFATMRFVFVVPFLAYVNSTATAFFTYQLVVAIIELAVLSWKTYRLLPDVHDGEVVSWAWQPLRGVLGFSLTIAFTSAVWILVTQADKLLLSGMLPLTEYAYFTLAVLVASGIMLLSGPIGGALLPRMTRLNAEGDEVGLIRIYRNATQIVAVMSAPPVLLLALFPEQVLWAWTGNVDITREAAPVLQLYALGNGILGLAAFSYYIQFAKGDLRLHLMANASFVALFLPLLYWAVARFGMVGAGYAWICANLLPFVLWLPLVHARFLKGLHVEWLVKDVGSTLVLPVIAALAIRKMFEWPDTRAAVAIMVGVIGLMLVILSATGSSWVRSATLRQARIIGARSS